MKKRTAVRTFSAVLAILALLLLVSCGIRGGSIDQAAEPETVVNDKSVSATAVKSREAGAAEQNEIKPPVTDPAPAADGREEETTSESDEEEQQNPVTRPAAGTPAVGTPVAGTHVHTWVDEIVAYHEAMTHTVHHDAVTEDQWIPVITVVQHIYCDVCHREFSSQTEAYAHEQATYQAAIESGDMSLIHAGHYTVEEYIDNGYWQTVTVREAWDETVIDEPAWEEHIFRCSGCGATA